MTYLQESMLYRVWMHVCGVYEESGVHRCLAWLGSWCSCQIDESTLLTVLCREGIVAKAWPESWFCRLLCFLINLPS